MRYSVKTYPDLLHYSLQVSGNRISRRILDIQPQLSDRPNTYLNIRQDTRYQQRADIRFIPYLRLLSRWMDIETKNLYRRYEMKMIKYNNR